MALEIEINGKKRSLEAVEPTTLAAVLEVLELRPDRIAIERNGEIVPRARWSEASIASGDRIEIVHFVGGGSWLYTNR
jgi:thiamine biosynthesis protein ThiS